MLHASETFSESKQVKEALLSRDAIFRYCTFESANIDGGDTDGVFLSCEFRNFEWYWGMFNLALFHNCKFEG